MHTIIIPSRSARPPAKTVVHVARKGLGERRCVATLRRLVADERSAGGAQAPMAMGGASRGVQLSPRVQVVALEPTSLHTASTGPYGTCPERKSACAGVRPSPLLARHRGIMQPLNDQTPSHRALWVAVKHLTAG